MDMLLSAVASDLISRFISFLIARYQKQDALEKLGRLQQLLLRARTIAEEADLRHITNRGMLLQLNQLREAMYQGCYLLDQKRYGVVSKASKLNKLQKSLQSLEGVIGDMEEFLVLLMECPRIVRQPNSTYLIMEKCMFGRHKEKEIIIDFLLQPCSFLAILPIIGPRDVGKRTLVEHVCLDEKVQKHFYQVQHLTGDDLDNENPIRYSSGSSLIVIEFLLHVNEEAWRRFHSSICHENSGNKIIIISRMKQVASLGTVHALGLKRPRRYEFCYFFKVLAFGSANPEDHHPELASIAINLSSQFKSSFLAANIIARLLRGNISARFWHHVQKRVRDYIKLHYAHFGDHPCSLSYKNRPYYHFGYRCGPLEDAYQFLSYKTCKTGILTQREFPDLTVRDLMTRAGRTIPCEDEKVDLILWQSSIPPYYSYISNCAVKKTQQAVNKNEDHLKRKRGQK